jgi:putative DNA primase/helicase
MSDNSKNPRDEQDNADETSKDNGHAQTNGKPRSDYLILDERKVLGVALVGDSPTAGAVIVRTKDKEKELWRSDVFDKTGISLDRKRKLVKDDNTIIAVEIAPYVPPKIEKPKPNYSSLSDSQLGMCRMSDIEMKAMRWLWTYRLAIGAMSLMVGDGGIGKSQVLLAIASIISRGGEWFDKNGNAPSGDVVILSAEDNPEDTIKPRLQALNADMDRVFISKAMVITKAQDGTPVIDPKSLQDLDYWREVFRRLPNCKLFIVDPLPSYLGKGINDHKNSEIRNVLEPFILDIVHRYNLSFLCNTHMNKSSSATTAMQRIIGSVAYGNLARNVHFVTRDEDDPERRILTQGKCNNAPDNLPSIAFRIETKELVTDGGEVLEIAIPVFESDPVHIDLDNVVNVPRRSESRDGGLIDKSVAWLAQRLSAGPVESVVCSREGDSFNGSPWPEQMDKKKQSARIKWWREKILKKHLQGFPRKSDKFQGEWMFVLPGWRDPALDLLKGADWDSDETA